MSKSKYDIDSIRKQLKSTGRQIDPDEFKPGKPTTDEKLTYRFFILPPLCKGDVLKSGVVDNDMDQFFIPHGAHWISNKPHQCPRLHDGSECPLCEFGFSLMKATSSKDKRSQIAKDWMPNNQYMVNVYFINSDVNPVELRGQVKYYNASKQVFDRWQETILRDSAGDAEDPKAFGVFFDENHAFVFNMEVELQGGNSSYKTSKFLPKAQPMVKDNDGEPNVKGIEALLKLRHNLFDKIEAPNLEQLKRIAKMRIDGDDSDDDAGFDHDESKPVVESAKASTATDSKTSHPDPDKKKSKKQSSEATEATEAAETTAVADTKSDDDEIERLLNQLN